MPIIIIFIVFVLIIVMSLFNFFGLFNSIPENSLELENPNIEIVAKSDGGKDKFSVHGTIEGFAGEGSKRTYNLSDSYERIKYEDLDELATIKTSNIKTNQYMNNTSTFNKNSFYLDFNLIPIEDISTFELYYDDTDINEDEMLVSMKQYKLNSDNGEKINNYFDKLNKDYVNNKIVGYTMNDIEKKWEIVNDNFNIPEKHVKFKKRLIIHNFYGGGGPFEKGKMYKIRVFFKFRTSTGNDFPIIIKDDSGGVNFITNNNLQLIRTQIHNKKYNIHNLKIYQKNFINKVNEIEHT